MNKMTIKLEPIAVILLSAAAVGCAATAVPDDLILCTDPRPEVCTMDYTPVCAFQRNDGAGTWETFSNACSACSNASVAGYRANACEADS